MKALVTGSTGFIGAAICRRLVELGHQVRAFHRATSNMRLLTDLPVEHAIGDLTHPETLAEAMQGQEVVFHTAALLGAANDDPGRFYAITVEGTRQVSQAALEAGVSRFIHTSSVAALGVPAHLPGKWASPALINERQTWNFRADYWQYGYAKYLAELEIQQAIAAGLDAVILNPTIVIGAGDVYRQTSSIVVQTANRKVPVTVEGGLNVVHLEDVVSGHLAALERGRCGERYILGGQNLTVSELVRRIAEVAAVPAPNVILPGSLLRGLARPYRLVEGLLPLPISASQFHLGGYYFYYDNHKARVDLGLENRFSLEDAIRDAYDWFKASGAVNR